MIWTAVVCSVCMLIFVVCIALPNPTLATNWTAVSFVIIFNFSFGYGWIGCPWLYGPEIAPLKYRHLGGAAGSTGEWLFSFITVFAGGIAIENIGWRIWIWQLVACIVAVFFIYFMCPETSGKSLEEIDLLFAKSDHLQSGWRAELGEAGEKESPRVSMTERAANNPTDDKAYT